MTLPPTEILVGAGVLVLLLIGVLILVRWLRSPKRWDRIHGVSWSVRVQETQVIVCMLLHGKVVNYAIAHPPNKKGVRQAKRHLRHVHCLVLEETTTRVSVNPESVEI